MDRLDAMSRNAMRNWTIRMSMVCGFVGVPCLVGFSPMTDVFGTLSVAFTAAGIVTMIGALLRREPPGQGSLNGWDESIAFNGAAIIAHVVQGLHA